MKIDKTALKQSYYILILLAVFAAIFSFLAFSSPLLQWDENAYLANARSHIEKAYYTENFRFPLLEYIISAVWLVTGESVAAAKIIMIIFTILTIYTFYLISSKLFSGKNALIATIVFSLCPLMIKEGFRIYTDIPALLFIMLSFYMLMLQNERDSAKSGARKGYGISLFLFAGIFAGLSFLMRYTMAIFVIAFIIYYLIIKRELRKSVIFGIGFAIPLIPWLILNWISHGNMLWGLIEQYKIVAQYTVPQPISIQLKNIILLIGPLALLIVPALISIFKGIVDESSKKVKSSKKRRDISYSFSDEIRLALIYVTLYLAYILFLVSMKLERYNTAIIAFIFILFFIGMRYLAAYLKRSSEGMLVKWSIYAIIIIWVIVSSSLAFAEVSSEFSCEKNGSLLGSVKYIGSNTMPGQSLVSNFWPYFGYYNNLDVHSFWTDDIDKLIVLYKANYYIYSNQLGGSKEPLENNLNLIHVQTIEGSCGDSADIYKLNSLFTG